MNQERGPCDEIVQGEANSGDGWFSTRPPSKYWLSTLAKARRSDPCQEEIPVVLYGSSIVPRNPDCPNRIAVVGLDFDKQLVSETIQAT